MASLPPGRGLVIPSGNTALAAALAHYLKLTLQEFLTLGKKSPERLRQPHARVSAGVREALLKNPRETLSCFGAPAVGAPIHCFSSIHECSPSTEKRIKAQFEQALPHLLLELAARGLIPAKTEIEWPYPAGLLASPTIDAGLRLSKKTAGLSFAPGMIHAFSGAGKASIALTPEGLGRANRDFFTVERPFRRLAGAIRLSLIDPNPLSLEEEHPDKFGNAISLGERPEEEWVKTLTDVLGLIDRHWPELRAEMSSLLIQIIPVGYDAQKHLSASYRQVVGTVYMTLHPSLLTMTEALIHEFQHNKMNLASFSDPILLNAFQPLYRSPVRPDPRPLWGILLAVHAFLAVAAFLRRLRQSGHPLAASPDFERRLLEIDLKNREGMDVLRAHARWTSFGENLMRELDELDGRHIAQRSDGEIAGLSAASHEN